MHNSKMSHSFFINKKKLLHSYTFWHLQLMLPGSIYMVKNYLVAGQVE
ncbi:hypothetical protein Leryth_006067, partial [Lithospermum erythrorhizon]